MEAPHSSREYLETAQTTILIVDDTPQNLAVLGEVLQGTYRVRVANSGERALRAVRALPRPDLILLDIMMPGMDGYEVLQRLKEDEETRNIPVIFITARTDSEDEEKGLLAGAVDYITKPFKPAVVLARVHTHLELYLARAQLARENDWLDDEVKRRTREILLIQDLGMKALANLAETRDMDTGLHITRVQAYVKLLATHLATHPRFVDALAGPRLDMIVKAAPLHDIGKVGIPDAILLKPGKLEADELVVMRTHAAIGARAIEKAMEEALRDADDASLEQSNRAFAFMRAARDIALSHHEKWNGSGYPAGLVGDQIPVGGRLMALADVFDALACRRVYKQAMPLEAVSRLIAEGRGIHFDPDIVDAYVELQSRFEEIATQYADPVPEGEGELGEAAPRHPSVQ